MGYKVWVFSWFESTFQLFALMRLFTVHYNLNKITLILQNIFPTIRVTCLIFLPPKWTFILTLTTRIRIGMHEFDRMAVWFIYSFFRFRHILALSKYDGYLDPKFVASINPFWYQFSPPSAQAHYTLGVIHLIIMVVGLFGNALVMFMFIRYVEDEW